jgi:hypothetical protein
MDKFPEIDIRIIEHGALGKAESWVRKLEKVSSKSELSKATVASN